MSSNPFAAPEDVNPFADPSIQTATHTQGQGPATLEYNPFEADGNKTNAADKSGPAVMSPISEPFMAEKPPPYSATPKSTAAAATDELRRKQEELERKAAELQERERQLQARTLATSGAMVNNFPPFTKYLGIQPCFYQDINIDIPVEFQKFVKSGYYLWLAHCIVHLYALICGIAYLVTDSSLNVFGLTILYCVLFIPCSYICWFRPLYKAFKNDSSFNFFLFFFIYFAQFVFHIIECMGISSFGTSGFLNGISAVSSNAFVGAMMIICGFLFASLAALDMFTLIRVHRIYRSGGVNFNMAAAQQEFSQGVMTNPHMQQAAANAAMGAARGAATSGTRY